MRSTAEPLERAELEAFSDQYRGASAETVAQCGVTIRELGVGRLLAATRLDVLALNRVMGLGLSGRPSDDALAEMIRAFEDVGSRRYFVQVPPMDETSDVGTRLEGLGLRHYNSWMRLTRSVGDVPEVPPSSVTVAPVGPGEEDAFTRIVADAFGYPPTIAPLAGCVIGRPGWHHYLAWENDEPIGTAAMFVAGEAAWFGFAATVEERRGRGAQTALVVRRLEDAAGAGCRWISVETAEQTADHEAPSFRNLTRLGFSVAYRRPNYLWTVEDRA